MPEVRRYEIESCPEHGAEDMARGHCRVVVKRTRDFTTFCHKSTSVTAIDERDVQPLVEAACAVLGEGNELEFRGALPGALKQQLYSLVQGLRPFKDSGMGACRSR